MQAVAATKVASVSEMAIVDTFTKLIFGEEEGYSALELSIIEAFRAADAMSCAIPTATWARTCAIWVSGK